MPYCYSDGFVSGQTVFTVGEASLDTDISQQGEEGLSQANGT